MSDPESQEPLVWEYLWNDPIPGDPMNIPESVKLKLDSEESCGFVENYHRGTGNINQFKTLGNKNLNSEVKSYELQPKLWN